MENPVRQLTLKLIKTDESRSGGVDSLITLRIAYSITGFIIPNTPTRPARNNGCNITCSFKFFVWK